MDMIFDCFELVLRHMIKMLSNRREHPSSGKQAFLSTNRDHDRYETRLSTGRTSTRGFNLLRKALPAFPEDLRLPSERSQYVMPVGSPSAEAARRMLTSSKRHRRKTGVR